MNVNLEVTPYCNAHCKFCPHSALTRPLGYMTSAVFSKTAEIILSNPAFDRVYFTGMGEPTLHPDLPKFVQALHGRYITVTSNGSGGADKVQQLAAAGPNEFIFSVNYLTAEQAQFNMGINYELAVESISEAVHTGIPVGATVVVSKLTQPVLRAMVEWLKSLGVQRFYFCPCHNRGGFFINPEIAEAWSVPCETCQTLHTTMNVAWNGDILSCCHDLAGEGILGNIMTDSAEVLLQSLADATPHYKRCRICNDMYRLEKPQNIRERIISLGIEPEWITWPKE